MSGSPAWPDTPTTRARGSSPDRDPRSGGGPTGHRSRGSRRCGSTGPPCGFRRATTTPRPPHPPAPAPRGPARPPREGVAAMWIDGTAVGVPSDYYYLAATGPALDVLTGSEQCRATQPYIVARHLPAFANGAPDSPGDYVAHGLGTCTVGDRPTRWAYFVAAPGYGPLREVGIPSSGLYVVVAVMPASPRASFLLNRLLRRTEFNGSSVADMLEAAAPPAPGDLV